MLKTGAIKCAELGRGRPYRHSHNQLFSSNPSQPQSNSCVPCFAPSARRVERAPAAGITRRGTLFSGATRFAQRNRSWIMTLPFRLSLARCVPRKKPFSRSTRSNARCASSISGRRRRRGDHRRILRLEPGAQEQRAGRRVSGLADRLSALSDLGPGVVGTLRGDAVCRRPAGLRTAGRRYLAGFRDGLVDVPGVPVRHHRHGSGHRRIHCVPHQSSTSQPDGPGVECAGDRGHLFRPSNLGGQGAIAGDGDHDLRRDPGAGRLLVPGRDEFFLEPRLDFPLAAGGQRLAHGPRCDSLLPVVARDHRDGGAGGRRGP